MSFNASSVNPAEIERIVREVLRNLSGLSSAGSHGSNGTAASSAHVAIAIDASVVSVDVLQRLKLSASEKKIQIRSSAVLTPSARDWCRERGIEIVRAPSSGTAKGGTAKGGTANSPASNSTSIAARAVSSNVELAGHTVETATKPRRLFIAGSISWVSNLEKQLCPRQTQIDSPHADDASAMRSVARAIRSGNPTAMAIVAAPHSALWQAARDDALRPAVVSQWIDLPDVLREVPTNVLIVPSNRWNIAGVANIARHFLDHSRSRS